MLWKICVDGSNKSAGDKKLFVEYGKLPVMRLPGDIVS